MENVCVCERERERERKREREIFEKRENLYLCIIIKLGVQEYL